MTNGIRSSVRSDFSLEHTRPGELHFPVGTVCVLALLLSCLLGLPFPVILSNFFFFFCLALNWSPCWLKFVSSSFLGYPLIGEITCTCGFIRFSLVIAVTEIFWTTLLLSGLVALYTWIKAVVLDLSLLPPFRCSSSLSLLELLFFGLVLYFGEKECISDTACL